MAQKTTTKRHENKDSLNLLERGSSSNPATIGDSKFNRQTGALLANRRRCNQIRSWHPRLSASIRGTKPVNAKTPTILLQATGLRTIQPSSNERLGSPSTANVASICKRAMRCFGPRMVRWHSSVEEVAKCQGSGVETYSVNCILLSLQYV